MNAWLQRSKKFGALVIGATLCVGILVAPPAHADGLAQLDGANTDMSGEPWTGFGQQVDLNGASPEAFCLPNNPETDPAIRIDYVNHNGDDEESYWFSPADSTYGSDTWVLESMNGTTGQWSITLVGTSDDGLFQDPGLYTFQVWCIVNGDPDNTADAVDLGAYSLSLTSVDMNSEDGWSVAPDRKYGFRVYGFAPGDSITARLTGGSLTPTNIADAGTAVDQDGNGSFSFTVPDTVPVGDYTLTVIGSASDRQLAHPFSVVASQPTAAVTMIPASGNVYTKAPLKVSGAGCVGISGSGALWLFDESGLSVGWADVVGATGKWTVGLYPTDWTGIGPNTLGPRTIGIECRDWDTGDTVMWYGYTTFTVVKRPTGTYVLTFNANGGKVSSDTKVVKSGAKYGTLPTPARTGYSFQGWYTKASGGSKVTSTTKASADKFLYAHWKAKSYKITFNANGGKASKKSKTVTYGSSFGSLPTASRTGYSFQGWFTAKSGGTKVTSSTKLTKAAAQTLYAQWKAKTYKVTLKPQSGTVTPASITVTYGSTYQNLPTPTRFGYKFLGWYTKASGGTKVTNSTKVKITKAQTLYAHWAVGSYTVTFDPNGGSVATTSKTVKYNTKYGTLPTPTWDSHTFSGWFTDATNGTLVTASTVAKIGANQTLYAHWG